MYEPMYVLPSHMSVSGMGRFHHDVESAFGVNAQPASIRSVAPGAYPAINISTPPARVEVCAFAPGIDASKVDITVDKGILTLSGDRPSELPAESDQVSIYTRERVGGSFRRAVSLPDDVDIAQAKATYRDGMLVISLARNESVLPTRIEVQ